MLSMFAILWNLGERFQRRVPILWTLALYSWHSAGTLSGSLFFRNVGRSFVGLESPRAAFLAKSSLCPGTQLMCKSHMSLSLGRILLPLHLARLNSSLR